MRDRTAIVISSEAEKSKIVVKGNRSPRDTSKHVTLTRARQVMRDLTAPVISSEAEKSKSVVKGNRCPLDTSPHPDTMRARS